jgi:hypothetical protein
MGTPSLTRVQDYESIMPESLRALADPLESLTANLASKLAQNEDQIAMNDRLTMSERMSLRRGETYGTGTLFRFKASGLPDRDEAFFVNVHSGTPREPLWRIEGKQHWLRLKNHCDGSETVIQFIDGTELPIDISNYNPTLTDIEEQWRSRKMTNSTIDVKV